MGMDVFGKKPVAKVGEYFRRKVWHWHPLANLCQKLAPDICAACEDWHTNRGCGLDADGSAALATRLERLAAAGQIRAYVEQRDGFLAELPDEPCPYCNATGIRDDEVGRKGGQSEQIIDEPGHPRYGQKGSCNGCNGRGYKRPDEAYFEVTEEDVSQFVAFLKTCGGFEIF